MINVDGSGQVNLTDTPASDALPDWSPDGTKIAFASARSAGIRSDIFKMNADGTRPDQRHQRSRRIVTTPGMVP